MSDIDPDKRPERRSHHHEPRSAPQADRRPSERRPRSSVWLRDPFDDSSPTIEQRRLNERRAYDRERSFTAPREASRAIDGAHATNRVHGRAHPPAISSFVSLPADELLAPDNSFAIDDDGCDPLIVDLIAPAPSYRPAPLRRSIFAPQQTFSWWPLVVCVVSLVVLYFVWFQGGAESLRICAMPGCAAREQTIRAQMIAQSSSHPTPDGQHSVLGPPSISAQQIDRILAEWRSPAAGTGATWVELGVRYGIDPAYALAFFIHESGAGTAPGWAGRKLDGSTTHNVGNIICAGYRTCYGRFRDYASWEEGIEDWYRLIAVEYVQWRGVHTVEQIVPIYAPAVENNVPAYIDTVNRLVAEWRALRAR
ncbi:MAG: glucosaminidase domain-containing protein [Roseiflexaceae bacterium]|nr:glucosaminidase domain-containing protein [Roseiflexus sp.]MDW8212015.1 glucosaminidase domain-containing protein [Roseiflexaceae bacterium]